uniref:Uncharacterized protein n=1 Tax=Arundo donax TaxID=35708 RepID=A0A0A9BSD2_ARUDO
MEHGRAWPWTSPARRCRGWRRTEEARCRNRVCSEL